MNKYFFSFWSSFVCGLCLWIRFLRSSSKFIYYKKGLLIYLIYTNIFLSGSIHLMPWFLTHNAFRCFSTSCSPYNWCCYVREYCMLYCFCTSCHELSASFSYLSSFFSYLFSTLSAFFLFVSLFFPFVFEGFCLLYAYTRCFFLRNTV